MKRPHFLAQTVVVLRLTNEPDTFGHIIPPECAVTIKNPVPVVFENDPKFPPIGEAYVRRIGSRIVADIKIDHDGDGEPHAKCAIISKLYPTSTIRIHDSFDNTLFKVTIEAISIGRNKNADPVIQPLRHAVKYLEDEVYN